MFLDNFHKYEDIRPIGIELPQFSFPIELKESLSLKGEDNFQILRELCWQGVQKLGIDKKENRETYYDRLSYELDLIAQLKIYDYFLLVWDIIRFCKEKGIMTGAGRGSAAGSCILYCLEVTKVDPILHNLYFERFLSIDRVQPQEIDGQIFLKDAPDVDLDIENLRRQEVLNYLSAKFEGNTCKILTFVTLTSKRVLKDVAKIYGNSTEEEANYLSGLVESKFGKVFSLEKAAEESIEFKDWALLNREQYEIAKKLEGLIANSGVHPSGIIVSRNKLDETIPLKLTKDREIISGFDMKQTEKFLIKVDCLGLRTLDIIHKIADILPDIKIEDIKTDDPFIYESLQNYTCPYGVFQITKKKNSETGFKVAREIKPKNIRELSDVMAIARPGALEYLENYIAYKDGKEKYESIHPTYDKITKETNHVVLYQEQLMRIAHEIFEFTLQEANVLRKIVGKKLVEEVKEWKDKIYERGTKLGINEDVTDLVWNTLEASANYSFNLSHSISYASLSALTVYLKFKYPQEFFLACLHIIKKDPDTYDQIELINHELKLFGIELLPPELSLSDFEFKKEGSNIRYGLDTIKGISESKLERIIQFRKEDFNTKWDMFESAKQAGLDVGAFCALIKAGALRSYQNYRSLTVFEAQVWSILTDKERRVFLEMGGEEYNWELLTFLKATQTKKIKHRGKELIKPNRFYTISKNAEKYRRVYSINSKYEKFSNYWFERSLLGYSYSYRLLDCFVENNPYLVDLQEVQKISENTRAEIVGIVKECRNKISKKSGKEYYKLDLTDESSTLTVMIFGPKNIDKFKESNKIPKKNMVVLATIRKWTTFFVLDDLEICDEKIIMKTSELK